MQVNNLDSDRRVNYIAVSLKKKISLEVINPLEENVVNTPEKVISYFPKNIQEINELQLKSVTEAKNAIELILSIPGENRTFSNTFFPLDANKTFFESRMTVLKIVSMTHPHKEIRDAAKNARDEMNSFLIENFQNSKHVYQACQDVINNINEKNVELSEQQIHYLEIMIASFKREGLHLSDLELSNIKSIKTEISNLESTFLKNLDEDKSFILINTEDLNSIPSFIKDNLEKIEDNYKLPCDVVNYFNTMRFCSIEETRKKIHQVFCNRANNENIPLLQALIEKRNQLAILLGYKNFTDYDIENQMAKKTERIEEFLSSLTEPALNKGKKEFAKLAQDLPPSVILTEDKKIKFWDLYFLSTHYKKTYLNIDEIELQKYFSFEPTLEKMLKLYAELFNLKFEFVSNEGLWDPSTKMIAIYCKDENQLLGHVILDPFSREGKYGHAYCVDTLARYKTMPGEVNPGIATLLLNLPAPGKENPSLLTHSDVETLFHEFGHALHQLIGLAEMPSLSGYHTTSDFLEIPSQLLEELMWDPKILNHLGEHYQTKAPIPEKLLNAKVEAKNYMRSYFILGNIELAMLSLNYFKGGLPKDTASIREKIENKLLPFLFRETGYATEGTIRHLADPLYAAKYYSYVWSMVIAKDIYNHIQSLNNESLESGWVRYRKEILEPGGGLDPNKMLKRFLGRAPSVEALMKTLD